MGKRKNRTFKLKKKILMKGGGGGFVESLRGKIIDKRDVIKKEIENNNRSRFVKLLDDAIALARQEHEKAQLPPPPPPPVPAPVVKSPTDSEDDSIYIFDKNPRKEEEIAPAFKKLFPNVDNVENLKKYQQVEIDNEINALLTGEGDEVHEQVKADKEHLLNLYEVDPDKTKRENAIAGYLLKVMENIEHLQDQRATKEDKYDLIFGDDDYDLQINRATAYLYFVREFYKNDPTKEDWKLDQLLVNLGYDPENDDKIDELFNTIFGENIFNEQLKNRLQNPYSVKENNPFVHLISPKEDTSGEMQTRIITLQKLWWLCRSIDVLLETDSDMFSIRNVPYGKTIGSDVKSAMSWSEFSSNYDETIASKTECGESKMKSDEVDKPSCDLYKKFHGLLNIKVKNLYEEKPTRTNEEGVKVDEIIAILEEEAFKQEFKDIKRYDLLLLFLKKDNKIYENKYYPKRRFNKIQRISYMSDQKYMELLAQGKLETGGKRKRQRKTKRRKTQRRKKNITKRRKKRSYRRK